MGFFILAILITSHLSGLDSTDQLDPHFSSLLISILKEWLYTGDCLKIYTQIKEFVYQLHDSYVCTIITMCVRPSVRGQLVKMLITFEPHGIFLSNCAYLCMSTSSIHLHA